MPYDLTGRSLTSLSELIGEAEFPLADYLPLDEVSSLFQSLYVAEHFFSFTGDNLVLECHLAFESELSLALPGADSFALVLGSAGPGWTAIKMELTIGPNFGLVLSDLTLSLRFDPEVLCDPDTGAPAELSFACTVSFSGDGVQIRDYAGLSLSKSALCGTEILIEASRLQLIFDGDERPSFLEEQEDFRGLAFAELEVSIPSKYLSLDPGSTLEIQIENGAIGNTGFTGQTSVTAGAGTPVTGSFLGFPCRIGSFELDIVENALIAAGLALDIRLEALEENGAEKWVGLDIAFDQGGGFAAEASASQPPGTSNDPDALVTLDYPGAVKLALEGLRVTREAGASDLWAVYFSGDVQVLVPGATWPKIGFDELGVNSEGKLLLPEGGGITFATPLVVEWYFVRLTIPKFRFGRPEGSDSELQVQLAAEVDLVEGLPAGASVEGLTVTWDPASSDAPAVSFTGIGIDFGVPGTFSAGIEVGFIQQGDSVEFRGQGHLELSALDMGLQIGVIVGYDSPNDFAYLYLFADAKLLPTGIPIGQSGLSIYGFQGLIAYNMALALDQNLPEDERYYQLFVTSPIGITDIGKWRKQQNQNALGIGVVLGSADKGFSFNVKGLFAVAFPDLVLLLQAKANFIKLKPDLKTESEGTMDALMVFDSVQNTFTFDVVAFWGMPGIVEITGSARVFFDFDDPGAFYLRIGQDQDGKRVSANVIRWGEKWLFTAGFWFELNTAGVITGVLIEVGARYEKGGFWIEAIGRARGEMALFWEPPQWEGSLALEGRIGAGYKGISVGISLGGTAQALVARPMQVQLRAEACFKALFWNVCKGHTFKWEKKEPPLLERPLRNIAAKPFDWTLLVEDVPAPGGVGGKAEADDGVVQLMPVNTPDAVQPHSAISIDFAKPMIDNTGLFNEAVALPNNGFLTVGENSGYAAAYELTAVRLVRDPDGDNEAVDIWGVWALETPNYNTSLRLLSSDRFGHDGSLTESFVEGVELDYCAEPEDRRICLPLAGLIPGFGWLANRYPYHWDTSKSPTPYNDRRNDPFVELLTGDRLSIYFPAGVTDVEFVARECPKRLPSEKNKEREKTEPPFSTWRAVLTKWVQSLSRYIQDILARLRRIIFGESGDAGGTADTDQLTTTPARKGERGESVIVAKEPCCIKQVCFKPGHGAPEYVTGVRRGGSRTKNETWTVPAQARLLQPGDTYELTVELKTRLRDQNGAVNEQSSAQQPWTSRFRVGGPPGYSNALTEYVAATYPAAGARPIYTGYDFMIRFVDDYVPFLYAAAQQQLLIRLFDGQGEPVTDTNGDPVLLPATREGRPERTLSELYWERQYRLNVDRGCIEKELSEHTAETILTIPGPSIVLTPNSQYVAQIVSDAAIDVPLHAWTFTTSAFATFTDLVTGELRIAHPKPETGPANGGDFDSLCRQLNVETVAFVDRMTLTPIVSLNRTRCIAVLLEAPEPLEASNRLTVELNGDAVELFANVDETRMILRRPGGDWPSGDHLLRLRWSRGHTGDSAETLRAVDGVLGNEQLDIEFSSGGI